MAETVLVSQVSHLSQPPWDGTVGQQPAQPVSLRALALSIVAKRNAAQPPAAVPGVPTFPIPMPWDSGTVPPAIDPSAIAEISGIPDEWKAGYVKLHAMSCPSTFRPDRWNRIVMAAGLLLTRWGAQLAALGWTTADLFAAHPEAPLARYDHAGLVLLLAGCEVAAVTADAVTLRTCTGAVQSYRRCTRGRRESLPLWETST